MQLCIVMVMTLAIISTQATFPDDMLSMMDENVNPCNDFYQYSCGGWLKNNTRSTATYLDSAYSRIRVNNDPMLSDIIKENHPILSQLWHSCMASDEINRLDKEPLQKDLQRIVDANTSAELMELAGEFARTGSNAIVRFEVYPIAIDAKTNTLLLLPANLTLPHSKYYVKFKKQYQTYIMKLLRLSGFSSLSGHHRHRRSIFKLLGFSSSSDHNRHHRPVGEMVIGIEKKLETFHALEQSSLILSFSIAGATKRWPTTVDAYLKGLELMEKTNLQDDFIIYIQGTDYFDAVEKMMTTIPVADLKTYLAFVMVHSRIKWLGDNFSKVWFDFFGKKINGRQKHSKRNCKAILIDYLPDLMGKYYYKKAFDSERQESALEMIKLIQEAMGEQIAHSTWLDTDTIEAAITKLNEVILLIGQSTKSKTYPFTLSSIDYAANIHKILSHAFDTNIIKVGQLVDRMEWETSSLDVNSYYSPRFNTITFPTAILQLPLFNGSNFHPARNFGGIGTLMGHELTHGFDTVGRFYDGDGKRIDWTDDAAREYEKRAQCIREQYSTFLLKRHRKVLGYVNGNLTLNENIADIGGVAVAWDAYRSYMTRDKDKIYDESPQDGDKMFFIAFGQSWCSVSRVEWMKLSLLTDTHSPDRWRVNGVVMNNPDFARVFNCSKGTSMNPITQCRLWSLSH